MSMVIVDVCWLWENDKEARIKQVHLAYVPRRGDELNLEGVPDINFKDALEEGETEPSNVYSFIVQHVKQIPIARMSMRQSCNVEVWVNRPGSDVCVCGKQAN